MIDIYCLCDSFASSFQAMFRKTFPRTLKSSAGFHKTTCWFTTAPRPLYHTQSTTAYMKLPSMVCLWCAYRYLETSLAIACRHSQLELLWLWISKLQQKMKFTILFKGSLTKQGIETVCFRISCGPPSDVKGKKSWE